MNRMNEDYFQDDVIIEEYDTDVVKTYLRMVNKNSSLLSKNEEQALLNKISEGDNEAKNQLFKSNLRLVVNIAKKYKNLGIDFMDLIQEGNMGLLEAIEKYDISKETKFSTVATFWIKKNILRYIYNNMKNVRIPENRLKLIIKYKKVYNELSAKSLNKPTLEEISKEMELDKKVVESLSKISMDEKSLNEKIKTDYSEIERQALLVDNTISVEDEVLKVDLQESVRKILNSMKFTDREKQVLNERILKGQKQESVGIMLNITKQRVMQLEQNIKRKLKNSDYYSQLYSLLYFEDEVKERKL